MKTRFKVGDRVVACFDVHDRKSFSGSYEKLRDAPYAIVTAILGTHNYLKVKLPCGEVSTIYPERVKILQQSLFENDDIFII